MHEIHESLSCHAVAFLLGQKKGKSHVGLGSKKTELTSLKSLRLGKLLD